MKWLETDAVDHSIGVFFLTSPNLELSLLRIGLIKRSNRVRWHKDINLERKKSVRK
jgi:hypothetical protein